MVNCSKINKIYLFIASGSIVGKYTIVRLLIDAGADLNIKNNAGDTALHVGQS